VLIQALLAQPPVERPDVRIVGRFGRPREGKLDALLIRSLIQRFRNKLRTVVHLDPVRLAATDDNGAESSNDILTSNTLIDLLP